VLVSVTADGTNTSVSSGVASAVYSQPLTATATITAQSPGSGIPTGTVQFQVDGSNFGIPATVQANGQATLPLPLTLTATGSPHTIKATFTPSGAKSNDYTGSFNSYSQVVVADDTVTTVTSSATNNIAVYGQPLTVTATVAAKGPGAGIPVGNVVFTIDGSTANAFSSGTIPLTGGVGKFVLPSQLSIAGSPHTVSATYTPTGTSVNNFNGGTSATPADITIQADDTTTVVTSSTGGTSTQANAGFFGESITFTATVGPVAPGVATPTGNVQFQVDGGTTVTVTLGQDNLGDTGLPGNIAEYVTTSLSVTHSGPPHTIVATYVNADGNFNDSNNSVAPLEIVINGAGTSTNVSLTSSTAVYSQAVTLLATVAPLGLAGGTPSGSVTFFDVNTSKQIGQPVNVGTGGNAPNVAGLDISQISPLLDGSPAGVTYNIKAVYAGDPNYAGSDNTLQPPPALTIKQNGTTISNVTSSDAAAVYSEAVTFKAIVTPNSPGTAVLLGSTVNFLNTVNNINTKLGSGPVQFDSVNNVYYATYTTTALTTGSYQIKAQYVTNNDDSGSTSPAALTQSVSVAQTSVTSLTSSNSTSPASGDPTYFGQAVTFTAVVASNAPGTATPTGSVTFKENGVAMANGTVNLVGNTATFAISTLPVATSAYQITAVYNGALGKFAASTTNPTIQQTVLSAQTNPVLVSPANSVVLNSVVVLTASIAVVQPGAGNPTGTVQFKVDGKVIGTPVGINSKGLAIANAGWRATPFGQHSVTIVYNPGVNNLSFAGSTSTTTINAYYADTVTASTSPNPAFANQTVVVTAVVTAGVPATGAPQTTPHGSVNFLLNGQVINLAPIPLTGLSATKATATYSLSNLLPGTYNIAVQYLGDGTFAPNMSSAVSQAVYAVPASIQAFLAQPPLAVGMPFTVTAKLFDSAGKQILLSAGPATITEISGPLGGFTTTSVQFNNKTGMFTFSNLRVTKATTDKPYVLQISYGNLPPVTVSFSLNGRIT
jgi:hypothetical protein